MIYQLVCEGACNPTVAEVDGVVRDFRRRNHSKQYIDSPPDHILADLHSLQHTPHEPTDQPSVFVCLQCASTRRYGWAA